MKYLKSAIDYTFKAFSSYENGIKLGLVFLTSLGSAAVDLAGPYVMVKIFSILDTEDEDNETGNNDVYYYVAGYCGLWAANHLLQSTRLMLLSSASGELSHTLVTKVISSYYDHPMQYRASQTSAAEVQFFSHSYEHIGKNFVTATFSKILPSSISLLAAVGILIAKDDSIGLLLVATAVTYMISAKVSSKLVGNAKTKWNTQAFKALESILQRLNQYENVAYFGNNHHELDQLNAALNDLDAESNLVEYVREGVNSVQSILIAGGFAALLSYSVHQVREGHIKVNDFIWFALYLTRFSQCLDDIAKAFNQLNESYANFRELHDYLEEGQDEFNKDAALPDLQISLAPSINFEHVSLKHPDQKDPALKDVSFSLESGENLVIMGESGSGKTSMVQLLLRFYEPTAGKIKVCGQDISQVNKRSLRRAFSIIPQTPYVLNESFYENIRYGDLQANTGDIYQAIGKAWLTDVIHQFGQDTPVGDGGKKISGGQRQRISIARAVLRKTPFVLTDEMTTGLDARTASIIIKEVNGACKDSTTMHITHDMTSLRDYHGHVMTMEKGSVVEFGTIEGLLKKNGFFAKQYQSSLLQQEVTVTEEHDIAVVESVDNTSGLDDSAEKMRLRSRSNSSTSPLLQSLLENERHRRGKDEYEHLSVSFGASTKK